MVIKTRTKYETLGYNYNSITELSTLLGIEAKKLRSFGTVGSADFELGLQAYMANKEPFEFAGRTYYDIEKVAEEYTVDASELKKYTKKFKGDIVLSLKYLKNLPLTLPEEHHLINNYGFVKVEGKWYPTIQDLCKAHNMERTRFSFLKGHLYLTSEEAFKVYKLSQKHKEIIAEKDGVVYTRTNFYHLTGVRVNSLYVTMVKKRKTLDEVLEDILAKNIRKRNK